MAAIALLAALALAAPANADFRLDDSFGGGDGVASVPFGFRANVQAIATDGAATYIGGISYSQPDGGGTSEARVAKLLPSGELDPSFHGDGLVDINLDYVSDLAVQPDGQIVVAGGPTNAAWVTRLTPSGQIDTSFGANGFWKYSFGYQSRRATGVALDSEGRILVSGYARGAVFADETEAFVARLDAGGELDGAFSGDGVASVGGYPSTTSPSAPGSRDATTGVSELADGKVCASGSIADVKFNAAVFCFTSNGTPLAPERTIGDQNYGIAALAGDAEAVVAGSWGGASGTGTAGTQVVLGRGGAGTFLFDPAPSRTEHYAVAPLGSDRFMVTGVAAPLNGLTSVPTFAAFTSTDATGPDDYFKFDLGSGGQSYGVDLAEDSQERPLVLLRLDDDAENLAVVARLTEEPGPEPEPPVDPDPVDPDPTDPDPVDPDPVDPDPTDPGHIDIGKIRAPKTIDAFLTKGAGVDVTCTRTCDITLALVATKRAAKRLNLPSRRIDDFKGNLTPTGTWDARFAAQGKIASALFEQRTKRLKKLGLRVVTKRVSYSD